MQWNASICCFSLIYVIVNWENSDLNASPYALFHNNRELSIFGASFSDKIDDWLINIKIFITVCSHMTYRCVFGVDMFRKNQVKLFAESSAALKITVCDDCLEHSGTLTPVTCRNIETQGEIHSQCVRAPAPPLVTSGVPDSRAALGPK